MLFPRSRRWAALVFSWSAAFIIAVLTGCASPVNVPETPSPASRIMVTVTVAPLPSLYPTTTRPAAAPTEPTGSAERPTPQPTRTPVNLDEPVLNLTLALPAVDLERTITGNLAGAVTLTDRATGMELVLPRSGRLLAEIRAALLETTVEPLPATGCPECLQISYNLPADGRSASGWLRDPILAASLEFLFTNALGPHFPEGTAVGFYRSASGYTIAHTAVVLEDGSLRRWLGPGERLLPNPESPAIDPTALLELAAGQPLRLWEDSYTADCPSFPLEILIIRTADQTKEIDIQCPELALPTTMIEFYERVNSLTADILADERNLPFPTQPLPLEALVFYLRPDGAALTLYGDGRVAAVDPAGSEQQTVIPQELVEPLVADLTNSEILPRGVTVLTDPQNSENFTELLLVRGELGVYEFPWRDRVGQGLLPAVVSLENLLIDLVGQLQENLLTPTINVTIDPSAAASGTPPPSVTTTPPSTTVPQATATP